MNIPISQIKPLTQEEFEARIRGACQVDIKLINKGKVLGRATVTIVLATIGPISIKGFLIFESSRTNPVLQDTINITPPSIQIFGKFHPQVFLLKIESWNLLQKIIYEKYVSVKEGEESF